MAKGSTWLEINVEFSMSACFPNTAPPPVPEKLLINVLAVMKVTLLLPTSRLIAPPSPLFALLLLNVDASTYSRSVARMAPPPSQQATLLPLNVLL